MTSPYLNLPRRTVAEAQAERGLHPSVVMKLDEARAKRMQALAIKNNVAVTTPEPRRLAPATAGALIYAVSFLSWMVFATLVLWVLVSGARYLLG